MMRSFLILLLTVVLLPLAHSQILTPVKWSSSTEPLGGDDYALVMTAKLDNGWAIYSQHTGDDGPVPTSFTFSEGSHYRRSGAVAEKGKKKEGYDELFGTNVIKFVQGPVVFTQRVTIKDYSQPIEVAVEYMTCDDERCLPPTEEVFSFTIAAPTPKTGAAEPTQSAGNTPTTPAKIATAAPQTTDEDVAAADPGTAPTPAEATTVTAREIKANNGLTDPVDWTVVVRQGQEGQYELAFTAEIEAGWTIYSHDNDPTAGPIPTSILLEQGGKLVGTLTEKGGKRKSGLDPVFGVNVVKYVAGPVTFTQQLLATADTVAGTLEYMSCDDEKCVPGYLPFRLAVTPLGIAIGELPATTATGPPTATDPQSGATFMTIDNTPVGECGAAEAVILANTGYWNIFWLGMLGGFLALLTPCVFPMIPLTVSFFTKKASSRGAGIRKAWLYGFFILLVYVLLSAPFHLMDTLNPDILNDISTNVYLNVFFFLIFVFFAFSFFGYYDLTIPQSWTNRAGDAEGIGGVVGIFFMALTLALVSFSCTGPILGSLLVGSLTADGGAMQLTAGMAGFGLALALPFALFAAFPGFMSSLPKSGGWLNSVKVVLGFAELALALKFLSNADLVKHWGLLRIELFLGLWIVLGIGLALYLLGKLRFPHDSPVSRLSPLRLGLGALTIAFVLYLASGFLTNERSGSYRPLGLLSGIAPPVCYSFFNPCDCPQGLDCFKDLDEGLAYARKVNKPVMIDFTGYACVNCRKMEEHVWPEKEVYSYLKDDYVLISLYVDDKAELPETEQLSVPRSNGTMRTLRRVGEKWAYFQTQAFNVNAQPYYVLVSPDGRMLNQPADYTPDPVEYGQFLRCGLDNFQRLTQEQQSAKEVLGSIE